MSQKKLNILFVGGFTYPDGMAGTKRIQHAINGLKGDPNTAISVVVLRQSSRLNPISGTHDGVNYETVIPNLFRIRFCILFPLFLLKAIHVIRQRWQPQCVNVLYNYGPPTLETAALLFHCRRVGWKVVVDIVEDYDASWSISRSIFHRVAVAGISLLKYHLHRLASGVIVISSRLHNKYHALLTERIPIHYRSISVDFRRFPQVTDFFGTPTTLFYSGSMGEKDGLPVLFDAFECLAERHQHIRLVLTGKGCQEDVSRIVRRIAASPCKDRIDYNGFLDDELYYATLRCADILLMTRIDSEYANAGFPFKLGEFLATGKPVVASRLSDVEYLLRDGYHAMLVMPGNTDDLVTAVDFLLQNPQEAIKIGKHGRERARELFDHQAQVRSLVEFFRSL